MRLVRFFLLVASGCFFAGSDAHAAPATGFANRAGFGAVAPADTVPVVHLLKLADNSTSAKPDSALWYANQALHLARWGHLTRKEADALESIGWVHYVRGDYPGSLRLYQQALSVAQAVGYAKEGARLHTYIGMVLQAEGAFPEALANNLAALKYYAAAHDTAHLAFSIMNVAAVEYHAHHYPRAISYYQQAIPLFRKNHDLEDLNASYLGLANVYTDTGNLGRAETYFRLGLDYFRRQKDHTNEAIVLNNLGEVYTKQKNYVQAHSFLVQALQLAEANHDASVTAASCAAQAQLFYLQGQHAQAQAYARRSLTLAQRIKARPLAKDACLVLANSLAAPAPLRARPGLLQTRQGAGRLDLRSRAHGPARGLAQPVPGIPPGPGSIGATQPHSAAGARPAHQPPLR